MRSLHHSAPIHPPTHHSVKSSLQEKGASALCFLPTSEAEEPGQLGIYYIPHCHIIAQIQCSLEVKVRFSMHHTYFLLGLPVTKCYDNQQDCLLLLPVKLYYINILVVVVELLFKCVVPCEDYYFVFNLHEVSSRRPIRARLLSMRWARTRVGRHEDSSCK